MQGVAVKRLPEDRDLMARARARRAQGESYRAIARDLRVAPSTVRGWCLEEAVDESSTPAQSLADELSAVVDALLAYRRRDLADVCKRASVALRTAVHSDDDDDPITMPDPGSDTRGWILAMIARTQRSYDRAESSRNAQAAKQYGSILERWAARLKQHDALHAQSADVIAISRADVDERMRALREKLRAATSLGCVCSKCGEAIRASWADD